jgi:alpha-1,6-mannosyltransferase
VPKAASGRADEPVAPPAKSDAYAESP